MALKGLATVMNNALGQMRKAQLRVGRAGMSRATLLVKRESMNKTPVDTGHLRASHETEVKTEGMTIIGIVRVTADYAVYVHEMPASFNFKRPGSGPKFLEKALYENQGRILELLRAAGRIP